MALEGLLAATYFGSTFGQYVYFFGGIIGAVLVAKIVYFFISKYGSMIASKTANKFDDMLIKAVKLPIIFAGFIAGLFIGYQFLTPDTGFIQDNFINALNALVIINLAYLAVKLVDGLIEFFIKPMASRTESRLDDQLIPVLSKLSKASIIVLALIIILSSFGIDVLPL